jgi:ornithine cyclodeaminase/alanine dehydrogenase-like protein (mu-crystallin family)
VPLYVTEEEVAELLTPAGAFEAVEAALLRLAAGDVSQMPREHLALPDGQFAVMACVDRALGYAGIKTYGRTTEGAAFVVVLFSLVGSRVEAIVEADLLGRLRTAAASAVAASRLARTGASSLGVLGCGCLAAAHVAAVRDALPRIERVVVYCPRAGRLEEFCAEHDCEAAESHGEAAACDVVVTATSSRDPVVRGEWLQPGVLLCAIGANEPSARELDNVVLERATFVCCDSYEQARREAGDLIEPVERGVLDWLEVHELQDVVSGELNGRDRDDDIVLFKSTGLPAWDVAAAAHVVRLAREHGAGRDL